MSHGLLPLIAATLMLYVLPACSRTQSAGNSQDCIAKAQTFVRQLSNGEYETAVKQFDTTMSEVMPAPKLRDTWQALLAKTGAFKQQVGTRTATAQGYTIVFITCGFSNEKLDVKVVLDAKLKIAGLFFVPTEAVVAYTSAPYTQTDLFMETQVVVGGGEWPLPGTITQPKGHGPFPALVLVHGSGPEDRDETIGPNKPFRDIAEGLASQGIAVLRYEKRTKAFPAKLASVKNFTIKEETIDDAVAAVKLLQSMPDIDARRIFVLGHSLGGMVLPRIARAAPQVLGLISLAGSTRRLDDVMIEQVTYIASLGGAISEADKAKIDKMKQDLARLNDPDISNSPDLTIMGAPVYYWLDLRKINPPIEAKTLLQPMLILQGGNDYQVTEQDFSNWKSALSGRSNVEFKFYPGLYHLFIAGEKAPSAYQKTGHVAKSVIDDMAAWIKRQ